MVGGASKPDSGGAQTFKRNIVEGVLGYLNLWPVDGKIVLNDKDDGKQDSSDVGWQVSEDLRKSITAMYGKFINEDGSGVDYAAMRESAEFDAYVQLSYKLQKADLSAMASNERAAFFVNIYNSLLIHAICVLGAPADLLSRLRLYAVSSYTIAGHAYSLNDIENGILRSNRPGPGPLARPPFSPSDPRSRFVQPTCDARVHFALNCGARGCPPIRFYSPDGLDAELDKATRAFCASVLVDKEAGALELSEIFKWYKDDFTEGGRTLLQFVEPYLSEEKRAALSALEADAVKITYQPYDWGLNSN